VTIPLDAGEFPADGELTQPSSATALPAEAIGPYRLLELVGEGGMGQVWLAQQTRPVHRLVAVKIIKAGMDTAQVVARFEAERQALALMDHPAIARVFDAGATPQGRPYFVMEYVRGEAFCTYAARHKLSISHRIALFTQVCDGVQHAHQKGIIHRDLKPSNVLIALQDDHPVPKIIDFGVAKATAQSLTERTLHTEIGALVGTPEYMSPEQAEMIGLDIDTRTDVYALGVILYELLTGTLPFETNALRAKGLDEIRRTIREVEPPKPSTRVTTSAVSLGSADAGRLSSQLRGDLDWITMKALEKDRTRRYATVGELAADLQRHLRNVPVLAGPPNTRYRLQKFVRRNRLVVAATAILIVLLVVFAGAMAAQARRIAHERDRANQEAQRANLEAATAKQTSDFIVGLFSVSDPSEARGNTVTAREILDEGVKKINRLNDQSLVQSRLERTLGRVHISLGLYALADPLLEHALTTQQRVLGMSDPDTVDTLFAVGELRYYERRFAEAEKAYREAAEQRRILLGPNARDTMEADMAVASACMEQGRFDEAERLFRSSLERQQRMFGSGDSLTLETLNNFAAMYYRQGRYQEALTIHELNSQTLRERFGDTAPRTLISQGNLADTLAKLGRFRESEQHYLTAVDGQQRVLGREHPATQRTIVKLVAMYSDWGKSNKAAEWRLQLSKNAPSKP
jgi:non-specific serine/threonine protein kinase/serine/threonine-protein kinase